MTVGGVLVHLLDIALLAVLFYRLLVLVQGTRAVQVLLGLGMIWLATLAAQQLNLRTSSWVLDLFWRNGLVILVVVFQPEIRSALAELGSQRPFRLFLKQRAFHLEEILRAARTLSRRKTGALIVLEGETGLKEYTATGTRLHAEVSEDLLLSIFQPKSVLHDGAVILSDGRILAARCLLPLSDETPPGRPLGTRHRAALGLSERSDATVIVISEETGQVSVAKGGALRRDLSMEELRRTLEQAMRVSS